MSATIIEGEASESDEEVEQRSSSVHTQEKEAESHVDKCSAAAVTEVFSLSSQVESISNEFYKESTKSLRAMRKNAELNTHDLKKTERLLQLLSNDLFRLEDKVDSVNSSSILQNIRLSGRGGSDSVTGPF